MYMHVSSYHSTCKHDMRRRMDTATQYNTDWLTVVTHAYVCGSSSICIHTYKSRQSFYKHVQTHESIYRHTAFTWLKINKYVALLQEIRDSWSYEHAHVSVLQNLPFQDVPGVRMEKVGPLLLCKDSGSSTSHYEQDSRIPPQTATVGHVLIAT